MKILYHECYFGFGDNIYERPFVVAMARDYDRVYVKTPFPQLYWDQDPGKFFFLPRRSRLRTQEEAIRSFEGWSDEPDPALITKRSCFWLVAAGIRGQGYMDIFFKESGLKEVVFDLPLNPVWRLAADSIRATIAPYAAKVAVIKTPTLRPEWFCPARNPQARYFHQAIGILKDHDYFILNVTNTSEAEEWEVEDFGIAEKMDLDLWTLLALLKVADLTLCPPSFLIPATLALQAPCFSIFGGYMAPAHYTGATLWHPRYGYAAPEPFCDCRKMKHDCPKEILAFPQRFEAYLERISVPC